MGMLETRLLDFDTVILTQANEGILPAKSIDDSWIPYDMKKQYGLPTRDEKNAIFSYHFLIGFLMVSGWILTLFLKAFWHQKWT